MMGWYGGGMGWGGWVAMSLVMAVFWGLVIFAVVAIFRGASRTSPDQRPPEQRDALTILDERFARGEIDEDEYRARRDVLTGTPR